MRVDGHICICGLWSTNPSDHKKFTRTFSPHYMKKINILNSDSREARIVSTRWKFVPKIFWIHTKSKTKSTHSLWKDRALTWEPCLPGHFPMTVTINDHLILSNNSVNSLLSIVSTSSNSEYITSSESAQTIIGSGWPYSNAHERIDCYYLKLLYSSMHLTRVGIRFGWVCV